MSRIQRTLAGILANSRALLAPRYTQLLVATDFAGWSIDEDAQDLIATAQSLGISAYLAHRPLRSLPQCVHYGSFFSLEDPRVFDSRHRISVDYYHGKPDQDPSFQRVFETVRAHAGRIDRVRLSCSGMIPVVRSAGIEEAKIHLIPIPVNPEHFRPQNPDRRTLIRDRLGIPLSAVVIGSFQKDGKGWGEGLEPKWVKGPDLFLDAVTRLKEKVPELYVLLTGPARGFVKAGLRKAGVPFRHFEARNLRELGDCYQALDSYIVASREEGGPKAVLESMASGIPIVCTRVGQAADLVRHGENAMLAEVGDVEAIVGLTEKILRDTALRAQLTEEGKKTAAAHTLSAHRPLWAKYLEGFVTSSGK